MRSVLLRLRDAASVAFAKALIAFLVIGADWMVLTFIAATVYVSASARRKRFTLRTPDALTMVAHVGLVRRKTTVPAA